MPIKIAYLTNVYPAPSHSFIRREILAHEAAGRAVLRYTIRRHVGQLADPLDREELARTLMILDSGAIKLGLAAGLVALASPARFLRAAATAWHLGRRGGRGGLVHLIYLLEACLLLRWLTAERVTHLHVHFGTNPAAVAMLCRIMGGPTYSFTVHGPDEFDSAPALALGIKARHARFVVGISEYGRSQLCRWVSPADYPKLKIVHCGLDDAFLKTEPTAVPDVPRLVFVGRLTATKGVYVLLEAIRVLRERGVPSAVVMIGDGPERTAIKAKLVEYSPGDSVQLLGWQSSSRVHDEIVSARAMVLPSFAEGLPVVLMEALALGRPVVTTWVAGIPELVENGVNGWLVPPGSAEALADAIEKALRTPVAQLTTMGLAGREKVLRQHNAATEATKLARLFEEAGSAT